MNHDYTEQEILDAWINRKNSGFNTLQTLRAFLDALPDRPAPQPVTWPGQQESIDAALLLTKCETLQAALAESERQYQAKVEEVVSLLDQRDASQAELAALRQPILADDLHMCPEYAPAPEAEPEPDPYAELKAARDAGKVIQIRSDEEPHTWGDIKNPEFGAAPDEYRIKPEPAAQPTESPCWTPTVGDTVRLKSGGPVMTVTDVDPKALMCAWMNAQHELQVEPITTLCLTPVNP